MFHAGLPGRHQRDGILPSSAPKAPRAACCPTWVQEVMQQPAAGPATTFHTTGCDSMRQEVHLPVHASLVPCPILILGEASRDFRAKAIESLRPKGQVSG